MDVILLEKVKNLGNLGDKVSVKPGYGRNYLVPQRKAVFATPENIADFASRRASFEKAAAELLAQAQEQEKILSVLRVTIKASVGEEGKLFGSIGTKDLADAITAAGVEVAKSQIRLPQGTLRRVGEHVIEVQLHTDIVTRVAIVIESEE